MKMRTYSGFRASYRHFLERNGFEAEGLNLHRFRHTYASMLLEQEINPKIVQKLLGHRDVSTTLGVYTHVVPEVFFRRDDSCERCVGEAAGRDLYTEDERGPGPRSAAAVGPAAFRGCGDQRPLRLKKPYSFIQLQT